MITVYTKPKEMGYCQQCVATVRKMTALDVPFAEENLYAPENAEILEHAKTLNITSAPVVDVQLTHERLTWGGYRPDLIADLVRDGLVHL